ncbi:MAG: type 1 glutamine amidotransferase domain-containing protein [Pseudomonadota bacterium]
MKSRTVLIPIPSNDFDPTEVAVSWKTLKDAGHHIVFATPDGRPGCADPLMISGQGLDLWGWVPILKALPLLGLALRANALGRAAYAELESDAAFQKPLRYADLSAKYFDGLLLPGGHAPRMKDYLESPILQSFVADFFETPGTQGQARPVAAICHGVVLAARSISAKTGRSVLHGRRTTALTWRLERSASLLMRYAGRFWDTGYYRTYVETPAQPPGYASVEMEVKRALAEDGHFLDVPAGIEHHTRKTSGLFRDSPDDMRPAWVVRDGSYLSARWPGDAHAFAAQFAAMLEEKSVA